MTSTTERQVTWDMPGTHLWACVLGAAYESGTAGIPACRGQQERAGQGPRPQSYKGAHDVTQVVPLSHWVSNLPTSRENKTRNGTTQSGGHLCHVEGGVEGPESPRACVGPCTWKVETRPHSDMHVRGRPWASALGQRDTGKMEDVQTLKALATSRETEPLGLRERRSAVSLRLCQSLWEGDVL